MIGIIAAVSINGVIGVDNKLPFNYPEDMKHFRKTTADSVVIMGRNTFESIGKPLPKRRNIVISKTMNPTEGLEIFSSVKLAIEACASETRNIWFIGGASIYEEGMLYADEIVLTQTTDYIRHHDAVKFPWINPSIFEWKGTQDLDPEMWADGSSRLLVSKYKRQNMIGTIYGKPINDAKA